MIAMALAGRPRLLIADEPTTALDVTVQAQILALLKRVKAEHGMGMLYITHDMAVVAEIADQVVVMYAGQVVESGAAREVFEQPLHPYTKGLLDCAPRLDSTPRTRLRIDPGRRARSARLSLLTAGSPIAVPIADDDCRAAPDPAPASVGNRKVRCIKADGHDRAAPLVETRGLSVSFAQARFSGRTDVHAPEGREPDGLRGRDAGHRGETGCGKSTLCRVHRPPVSPEQRARSSSRGTDISSLPERRLGRPPPRRADDLPGPRRFPESAAARAAPSSRSRWSSRPR